MYYRLLYILLIYLALPFVLALLYWPRRGKPGYGHRWVELLGIAGFPTLLAERDGQLALLTNGYQPLERLAPLLDRWLERCAHA